MFSFDLRENEKLVKISRQSESLLIKPAALVMIGIYIPLWFLLKYDLLLKFAWFLAAWTLILLLYAVKKYFLWLLQTLIITNKRIVLVSYSFWLLRQTEEIAVTDIGTIKEKTTGVFGRLFSYGNIELQGRGNQPLVISNISHLPQIKNIIWQLKEKTNANQGHPII